MMLSAKVVRRLLVAAIALLGLLAAVDVVALQVFESRGGAEIARGMAAERASLDLGGFPFLPGYIRGDLDDVKVDVFGATGAGLRVAFVRAEFGTARFPPGRMFSLLRTRYATRATVEVADVIGRAEIAESDLQSFLAGQVPLVDSVRVTPSGIEVAFSGEERDDGDDGEPPARFLPRIEEVSEGGRTSRELVLRLVGRANLSSRTIAAAEQLETVIDLPGVPDGLQPNVSLGNGVFTVEAAGPSTTLRVGEGGSREAVGEGRWVGARAEPRRGRFG